MDFLIAQEKMNKMVRKCKKKEGKKETSLLYFSYLLKKELHRSKSKNECTSIDLACIFKLNKGEIDLQV